MTRRRNAWIVAAFGALLVAVIVTRTPAQQESSLVGCCYFPSGCQGMPNSAACEEAGGIWDSNGGAGCYASDCVSGGACLADGTCMDTMTWWFLNQIGPGAVFHSGLACADFTYDCVGRGACCRPNGVCEVTDEQACASFGGIYRGDDTGCTDFNGNGIPDTCEAISVTCRSDSNEDGIVDIIDFLTLLADWGPCK